MEALIADFDQLVAKGGPSPSDCEYVNQIFSSFTNMIRKNVLPENYLSKIRHKYNDIFSEKTLQGFVAQKPHGYAGDFEIIDRIYTQWISPESNLSKWDYFFHALPAVQAVRNRKEYFKKLLSGLEKTHPGKTIKVLNVGSGPGRDMHEYYRENPGSRIIFECVDLDEKAINYARSLCHDFEERIIFHHRNIFRFRTEAVYDLVWSAGLFDYLNDRTCKYLLSKLHSLVSYGRELVIGNFSKANPNRGCMEFGEWFLEHRNDDDLISLASACGINKQNISIEAEQEGINLFLHIREGVKVEKEMKDLSLN